MRIRNKRLVLALSRRPTNASAPNTHAGPQNNAHGFWSGLKRVLRLTGIACWMTWACACGTTRTQVRMMPPPSEWLTPCQRPPLVLEGTFTMLVGNHLEAMLMLDDCSRKQAALSAWATETGKADETRVRHWWEWR